MLRKVHLQSCNQSTLTHRNQLGYIPETGNFRYIPASATIHLVSSGRKPVIVRKLTRDWYSGYAPTDLPPETGALELLDNRGKLIQLDWSEVKWVCYIREIIGPEGSGSDQPERILRRRFTSRPRIGGLWLRMTLIDGDELEGVAANDRSLVTGIGLFLVPPDTRSTTQRIFVPRSSIRELEVLAVIAPRHRTRDSEGVQPELFTGQLEDAVESSPLQSQP